MNDDQRLPKIVLIGLICLVILLAGMIYVCSGRHGRAPIGAAPVGSGGSTPAAAS